MNQSFGVSINITVDHFSRGGPATEKAEHFTRPSNGTDFVGTAGVIIILVTYFLLQTARLSSTDVSYSLLNLIGAALIALSLLF